MTGIILCYTHRVCLSLAITEMTIPVNRTKADVANSCPMPTSGIDRPVIMDIEGGKFHWDEQTQSLLLGSFYIGYLLTNIPAGYLCDRFGAKWVVTIGCFISSVCTLAIPPMTIYTSWHFVVGLRVLTGFGQAPIYPGATLLMARWIPDAERALVGGVVLSSLSIGTIVGNIPTAFILENMKSWVWVFYIYGIAGIVFCVLFTIFVYSSPQVHPYITDEEYEYLQVRIAVGEKHKVPWKAILSDWTVWGCIICQFGNDYTLFTVITNFPKYLNDVLKFTSKQAGLLVCIPQVALFVGSVTFGTITDAMVVHCRVKKVTVRVINTFMATMVPTVLLLVCCKLRCNRIGAISAITCGMITKSMFYGGLKVSIIDITKHHTGLVAAIVNAAGGVAGFIAPYTIGNVASENTFEQWDLVAYISLGISVVSIIPYALFCKAERKIWDHHDNVPEPEEGEKTGCIKIFSCVNRH